MEIIWANLLGAKLPSSPIKFHSSGFLDFGEKKKKKKTVKSDKD